MTNEDIARVAHEVNRAYCQALGDDSQPAWEDAPQWQRDSALVGVQLHIDRPEAGPAASHESWMAHKLAEGWMWGPTKDPENKRHPCMVPFQQLPVEQQAKDYIFRAVVQALQGATVRQQDKIAALEAKIDALMLEYCPDEMTKEQLGNWAAHQRPVQGEAT